MVFGQGAEEKFGAPICSRIAATCMRRWPAPCRRILSGSITSWSGWMRAGEGVRLALRQRRNRDRRRRGRRRTAFIPLVRDMLFGTRR